MSMRTKVIGRQPTDHGPYDPQFAYGKKFTVTLFDCGWESKHDNNTSAPATLNAQAGTITENTTDWKKVWGSYKQWLIDNGYQKMDASKVKDGNNTQHDINAAFANEIGSDSTPESIKGRVTNLEGAVGTGGSVDERIAAEGARHYLKSETYTKEEVNGMITTPDQGFVSVSATSETTAATDVLPATGEADTIYRVANWDGSQYDTSVYSEYSWNTSTNTYIKLSTKQVGIDDVPTAGSDNLVKSEGVAEAILPIGIDEYTRSFTNSIAYNTQPVTPMIPKGTVITSFGEYTGNFGFIENNGESWTFISAGNLPYTLPKNVKYYRLSVGGTIDLTMHYNAAFYKREETYSKKDLAKDVFATSSPIAGGTNASYNNPLVKGFTYRITISSSGSVGTGVIIQLRNGYTPMQSLLSNVGKGTYDVLVTEDAETLLIVNNASSNPSIEVSMVNLCSNVQLMEDVAVLSHKDMPSDIVLKGNLTTTLTSGTSSYDDPFADNSSPIPHGTLLLLKISTNAVFITNATYAVRITGTSFDKTYYFKEYNNLLPLIAPCDIKRLRVVIEGNTIQTGGDITYSLYSVPQNTESFNVYNSVLEDNTIFSLINRPKLLKRVNNVVLNDRPQGQMTAFKSLKPMVNYKGELCFEGMINYTIPDPTKPVLFEEHLLVTNRVGSVTNSFIYDFKDWKEYQSIQAVNLPNASFKGFALGSNSNGLILTPYCYYEGTANKVFGLMWSLDGGRTFEPATERIRAKASILESELTSGVVVAIDGSSYTVTPAATIASGFSSDSKTVEGRVADAEAYLSDKIILSSESGDAIRSLAYLLIEKGYKVRIDGTTLYVYYKTIGTEGNGQTFTVGTTTKTFSGGENLSETTMVSASVFDYADINNITYDDGTSVSRTDIIQIDSIIMDGNSAKISFMAVKEGNVNGISDIICMTINNVADIPNSLHSYSVAYKGQVLYSEPVLFKSNVNNYLIMGLRAQAPGWDGTASFVYSKDGGTTWSSPIKLKNNISVYQGRCELFHVTNPFNNANSEELFYNIPNSNTKNMYVAFAYDRATHTVYACTAPDNGEEYLEDLVWSEWNTIKTNSDGSIILNNYGYKDERFLTSDFRGQSSLGAFTYAPLHRKLVMLYTGLHVFEGDDIYDSPYASLYNFGIVSEPV